MKTRTYSAKKCDKLTNAIASRYRGIYVQAADECWPHARIIAAMNEVKYERLRDCDHAYLDGVGDTLYRMHYLNLVYTYVVHGVRMSIESEEYKAVSPQYVHEHCAESGAWAYRKDLNKLF